MTVGRIDKTATCVWSPPDQRCAYLAMGTVAGAFDATFSTATELEMYRLNDDHLELTGSISTASRFYRLSWSGHEGGVIAGGMDNGYVRFWDAKSLMSGRGTMISEKQVHQGDVKGLDVNPFQPHVVVSGGSNASILVWDLNNLDKQMTPGSTSQKLEDITYLEWNKQVPHILASGSNNGFSVIWDLKNKREVIQLANPTGRRAITALAWNPNNATQLLTACDDDNSPVIYSWDLRNAHAPEKVLSGHSKGVLSLSWCPKDLVSCSSFDGKVEVYSLQTFMKGGNSKEESDPFAVSSEGRLKQTPRWFKRPIGATFSMNGQIVLFSNKNVKVVNTNVKDPIVERIKRLEGVLKTNAYVSYCDEHVEKGDEWKFLKLMFERDPRQRLLNVLGFEKKKVEKKETEVKGGEGDVNEVKRVEGDVNGNEEKHNDIVAQTQEKHNDIVATSFDKLNLFGNEIEFEAQPQLLKKVNDKPFKLFKGDGVEDEITRSIIMGDLSEAVEELIRQDKWSDALVLSVCSGADTLIETQKRYFERYSEQTSYMRLLKAVVEKNMEDVLENVPLKDWKDILAVLSTFSSYEEYSESVCKLAERLEGKGMIEPSIICYLLASNIEKVTELWLKKPIKEENRIEWIINLIEKLSIYRAALDSTEDSLKSIHNIIVEFCLFLIENGLSGTALSYLSWLDQNEERVQVLNDLLNHNPNSFPFNRFDIQSQPKNIQSQSVSNQSVPSQSQYNRYSASATSAATAVYSGTQQGYNQSQSGYSQSQSGYNQSQSGYSQSQSGYSQSQQAYNQAQQAYNQGQQAYSQVQPAYSQQQQAYQSTYNQPQYSQSQPAYQSNQYQSAPLNNSYYPNNNYQQPINQFATPSVPLTVPLPSVPAPPPVTSNQPTNRPSSSSRKISEGYNDPPVLQQRNNPPPAKAPLVPSIYAQQKASMSNPPMSAPSNSIPQMGSLPHTAYMNPPVANVQSQYSSGQSQSQYSNGQSQSQYSNVQPPEQTQNQSTQKPAQPPIQEKKKNPPGDRSHIPPSHMPIMNSLLNLLSLSKQKASPQHKRMIDDSEKRINIFLDSLNNEAVSEKAISGLFDLSKALDAGDFNAAANAHGVLMNSCFNETGNLLMGVKRLLDIVK
ncbi:hypothetical protein O9G_001929 [Rozella allomycis CSF55]|uniref:Protein transport protein SEC31 n=1 Tax=Rozella allomycis (strain CSF55) TaxID=988480 RepID=A0A075APC1_ROZAC|nr:hypothetical protein O9G_001929 [Rozella allomycis CSF55]|eukprot:EPZ31919.1 hypothetical protein O9G_001929 [Rozella allomycis CSF55]